jgi:hypothetical protein
VKVANSALVSESIPVFLVVALIVVLLARSPLGPRRSKCSAVSIGCSWPSVTGRPFSAQAGCRTSLNLNAGKFPETTILYNVIKMVNRCNILKFLEIIEKLAFQLFLNYFSRGVGKFLVWLRTKSRHNI